MNPSDSSVSSPMIKKTQQSQTSDIARPTNETKESGWSGKNNLGQNDAGPLTGQCSELRRAKREITRQNIYTRKRGPANKGRRRSLKHRVSGKQVKPKRIPLGLSIFDAKSSFEIIANRGLTLHTSVDGVEIFTKKCREVSLRRRSSRRRSGEGSRSLAEVVWLGLMTRVCSGNCRGRKLRVGYCLREKVNCSGLVFGSS